MATIVKEEQESQKNSSRSLKRVRQQIEWRRNKVQELLVRGYNQYDIVDTLKISQSTISRDAEYLRQQAKENLNTHINERLPEEYQRCMSGIKQVLKSGWKIASANRPENSSNDNDNNITTVTDDRTRLQALALVNDCYKYIIDLTTNGVIITDAIKFVESSKEKLTSSKKEGDKESKEQDYDEDKDQQEMEQGEETGEIYQATTNKVF